MKWLKVGAVVFASAIVTTFGIDAADTLTGSNFTLLGQLVATESSGCPEGMVHVPAALTFSCVDKFEATAGSGCPFLDPKNEGESRSNTTDQNCKPVSMEKAIPWRFVTREQAATACLQAGKRLISSAEWHMIAAGTPDTNVCNVNSAGVRPSASNDQCISAVGANDTIGNVWEWTTDDVIAGQYQGRSVPQSGYVTQVDAGGFPVLTSQEPSGIFFEDYFWSVPEGAFGVLRGGFYGSKNDAGIYSTHAATLPTTAGTAIGFRCVL